MNYQIGRLGRVLVAEEATYGVTPTLLATHALRHLNVGFDHSPKNRVNSTEKRGTPGVSARFDRRSSSALAPLEAYLRPSGTIGTSPEAHTILKNALGTAVVGTLTTTATGAGTASAFTLTSVVGLTVGEFISVRRAANGNVPEARQVTVIAGSVVTVSPALGAAPAAADTVKAGVTYTLATSGHKALSVAHYLTDLKRLVSGIPADQLSLMFNNNEEAKFSLTGPGRTMTPRASVAALPGFTTVGSQNPPSGLAGGLLINGTAYCFISGDIVIANHFELINECYGEPLAEGFFRNGFRDVTFSLEAPVSDDFTLLDLAMSVADFELHMQTGTTEGNIVAVRAPKCQLENVPNFGDDNGRNTYSFAGVAVENSATANDEVAIGIL